MICVVLHSANPKIRDNLDVEVYAFSRTTEVTYLTDLPNPTDMPPPSIKVTHQEESTHAGGSPAARSQAMYGVNSPDVFAASPGRMQNANSVNAAICRTPSQNYTQKVARNQEAMPSQGPGEGRTRNP